MASNVGGLANLVEPGVNGLLVASRAAGAWADAVDQVLDEDHATTMSTAAVLLAKRYTWRSAAESLASLTDALAASGLVHC